MAAPVDCAEKLSPHGHRKPVVAVVAEDYRAAEPPRAPQTSG